MVVVLIMVTSVSNACKKSDDGGTQASGSGTGTASSVKSTIKASQNPVSNSPTVSTNKTDVTKSNAESENVHTGNKSNNSGNNENTELNNNITNSEDIVVNEEKPINLGGMTLNYITFSSAIVPSDAEGTANQGKMIYKLIKNAEEKYNFKMKIELITTDFVNGVISKSLAGINAADFIVSAVTGYLPFIQNNVIIPLDDYINFDELIMKANNTQKIAKWKGRYYGIVFYNTLTMGALIYNRSMLQREGQPDILELYKNSNWNWSTYLDIALSCTKDINGDGIIDQWGVTGRSTADVVQKIVNSNAVLGVGENNGKFTFNYTTPEGYRALQFMEDLFYVHKVYTSAGTTAGLAQYMKGNVAICFDDPWNHKSILKTGLDSITAPPPKGPDMTEYLRVTGTYNVISVNTLCKIPIGDAAKIVKEISIIWQEDGQLIKEYYDEVYRGDNWALLGTAQTKEEYFISNMRTDVDVKMDYTGAFNLTKEINAIIASIMNGVNVYTAVEEKKPSIEAIIDNYNN